MATFNLAILADMVLVGMREKLCLHAAKYAKEQALQQLNMFIYIGVNKNLFQKQ